MGRGEAAQVSRVDAQPPAMGDHGTGEDIPLPSEKDTPCKRFKGFVLEFKAIIWPQLSYMYNIYSTAVPLQYAGLSAETDSFTRFVL